MRLEKGTIKADIWSYGICIFELVSPCLGRDGKVTLLGTLSFISLEGREKGQHKSRYLALQHLRVRAGKLWCGQAACLIMIYKIQI